MRVPVFVFLWGFAFFGSAQPTFETGKVIDSIPVSENTKETFALYLPSSFDATQPSSIVFIFEPAARGKIGIEPFVEASEAYNHILICSNTTRNGPYERNFNATDRLFNHVFSNFKIKENQIFLAGFSGGARLASAIAVLTDQIAGVIACGAAFSSTPGHRPSIQKFAFVGICGDRDMNYMEMVRAKGYLQKFNFNQTLFIYNGKHSWPPSEQIKRAFDWLEIQSHKKGSKAKAETEIYKSYQKSYETALKSEADNTLLQAAENYERILLTYSSFYDLDSVAAKYKELQKSKLYKNSIKSLSKAFDKEAKLTTKFNTRFITDYSKPDKSDMDWWEQELGQLKESADPETNKMVERVRFKIFALAFSMNNPNLHQSSEKQKQFCNRIRKLIYPDS